VGEEYEYAVTAEGSEPIVFEALRAPSNLSIDQEGNIDWVPQRSGDVHISIRAKNKRGQDIQGFSIHVEDVAPAKEYIEGLELGKGIWRDPHATYGLVEGLLDRADLRSVAAFRDGLIEGYREGAKETRREGEVRLDRAPSIIDLVLEAAALKDRFSAGLEVGKGLRRNTVTVEDAAGERRQSTLGGGPAELAWKSGFVLGYATGGVTAEQAVRVYLALP
jgi:hypothetical protein